MIKHAITAIAVCSVSAIFGVLLSSAMLVIVPLFAMFALMIFLDME